MTETKTRVSFGGIGSFLIPVISALMALVITQNFYISIGVGLLAFFMVLTALLGMVPILGNVAQYYVLNYIIAKCIMLFSLTPEVIPIISVLWYISMFTGVIISLIVVIIVIVALISNN